MLAHSTPGVSVTLKLAALPRAAVELVTPPRRADEGLCSSLERDKKQESRKAAPKNAVRGWTQYKRFRLLVVCEWAALPDASLSCYPLCVTGLPPLCCDVDVGSSPKT